MSLLVAEGVAKRYGSGWSGARDRRRVLDGADFSIAPGESVALVGESGCGKSTLSRILLGLEKPDAGCVLFRGRDLRETPPKDLRRAAQIVFQDSVGALNPARSVGWSIGEPLRHLTDLDGAARDRRVAELLAAVSLPPDAATRLPGQLSGGQLQRACIARALAPEPELVVLDEAVSNLDLTLQIQILDLLADLRARTRAAFLLVTHDLRLVRRFAGRVAVLAEGRIVEDAPVGAQLQLNHPASRRLVEAMLPAAPRPRPGTLAEDVHGA